MGTRINTIMQTCFFAISGVLPRDEAIAHIKHADREDLRETRRGGRAAELRGGRRDARPSRTRWPCRRRRPPRVACRRRCRDEAPDFVQARHRGDAGEPGRSAAGQRVPGRRHLADRHREVGEAQHRGRDPGLGRGALHSVQQVRARLPARRDPRQGLSAPTRLGGAPRDLQARAVQGRRRLLEAADSTRSRSRPRTAPAARCA